MSHARWQPLGLLWNEFDRVQNEFNRVLRRAETPANLFGLTPVYPHLNIWDEDEHLTVEAELPGLVAEDLEILVTDGNQLALKGQRKQPEAGKTIWHRQERGFGSFSRSLTLPVLVDPDKVEATFDNGVLRLVLPKSPKAKPRRIEVKQS